jgi:hypothetical protein
MKTQLLRLLQTFVLLLMLGAQTASYAQTQTNGSYADFLRALATFESGMRPWVTNPYGYMGLFQMGNLALIDAGYMRRDGTWTCKNGVCSAAGFLANPDAQIRAIDDFYRVLDGYIDSYGLRQYIGQTIGGIPITYSGLLAGAHLVGIGGLRQWLQSNGSVVPRDGNGTPITRYVASFGGFDISFGYLPSWSTLNTGGGSTGTLPLGSGALTGLPGTGGTALPTGTGGINPYGVSGTADQAFQGASGISRDSLRMLIASVFIGLIFLLAALAYVGTTQTWVKRIASTPTLGRTMLSYVVLLSISIWLVS